MLRLHGFPSSNYSNIVKLTLLEKQLPFEEAIVYSGAGPKYRPDYLAMSPAGKIPCLETPNGFISESRAICEYLEDSFPDPALYPKSAFERAKVRELVQVLDLYIDLPARRVIRNYFGGKKPPDAIANEVRGALERGAAALAHLARFAPYLAGPQFGAADVSAANHLPFARMIAKQVLGIDPFANLPAVDVYLAKVRERPTVARVYADREADLPAFMAHLQKLYSA